MVIPPKLLKKWQALRSPADTKRLSERMDDSYPEVFTRAFRDKTCTDEVFKVMAEFYEEKAKLIKEFL